MLNSWDRMTSALNLEEPDRVPLFEMHAPSEVVSSVLKKRSLYQNIPLILNLLSSGVDPVRLNKIIAKEALEFHRRLGLDWIRVPMAYSRSTKVKRLGWNTWLIGNTRYYYSAGSLWWLDEPATYDPEEVLSKARCSPPEVDYDGLDILKELAKRVKERLFLSFDADGSWGPIVSRPKLLVHVLLWMRTRRDVVRSLIDYHTRFAIELGKAAIDEGADAILMCVDYGHAKGPWFSPTYFREFIKPALRMQVNAFKRRGAYAILHSDGNIDSLLSDIVDAGVDAYQGIDVIAGMNLAKVKRLYGDRICLIGNVNPRVLQYGSKRDVANEVVRCMNQGAPGGGYVLSTSANVSAGTNVENFLYMIELARRIQEYPRP